MGAKKKAPLTEMEWQQVFRHRCQSKQGQRLLPDEQALVERAYKENPERYAALDGEVFDATIPFGSTVTWDTLNKKK